MVRGGYIPRTVVGIDENRIAVGCANGSIILLHFHDNPHAGTLLLIEYTSPQRDSFAG